MEGKFAVRRQKPMIIHISFIKEAKPSQRKKIHGILESFISSILLLFVEYLLQKQSTSFPIRNSLPKSKYQKERKKNQGEERSWVE